MDKKDILIVAIIAIVASLAVSSFAPQVGLSPGISNVADACNGDKVCEMNNALIAGSLEAETAFVEGLSVHDDMVVGDSLTVKQGIEAYTLNGNDAFRIGIVDEPLLSLRVKNENNVSQVQFLTPNGASAMTIFGNGETTLQDSVISQLLIKNEMKHNLFTGNDTGFVCVKRDGTFFRSEVSCNTLE